MNHLAALELRLSNERVRLANAASEEERQLRRVWVAQLERELSAEFELMQGGMSDEALLAALGM